MVTIHTDYIKSSPGLLKIVEIILVVTIIVIDYVYKLFEISIILACCMHTGLFLR